jgi:homospermidine synthase
MFDFPKRILFVGYGAVGHCTLPILLKHINVPLNNITVLDFDDRSESLQPLIAQGLRWVQVRITPDNLVTELARYVAAGDVIIDLAWNIDCCEILDWCHERGVLYINTSVEVWDPYQGREEMPPTERTLYSRHMNIRRKIESWAEAGPTAVLEHGANPGLISHWVKQGLLDIGRKALKDKKFKGADAKELRQLVENEEHFNRLAMKLGVKVIHCSERDTQIANEPKLVDEFVNTWSIEGLREEGTTTAEMGWGTHEKQLPPLAFEHAEGPKNQICLARMGMNTWVRSWVPYYSIRGMVVRHGEAFTLSDKLTVWEDGQAIYRPTVHYAYCPCNCAVMSLHELRGYSYNLQPNLRIMTDEIIGGEDILGALIMGHPYKAWWTGSVLGIEESRRLVRHQNATTMQVAISVVSAVIWMIENPDRGVLVPDDLPYDYILDIANPYLGETLSIPVDWTPLMDTVNYFAGYNKPDLDWDDPWQFKNFFVEAE